MTGGIPAYQNLQLRIERQAGGMYQIFAFAPDGSTGRAIFTPPLSDDELDDFVRDVGLVRRTRGARPERMEKAKDVGRKLFDALMQEQVGDVFQSARTAAQAQGQALRITLCLSGAPELMRLPWEFLYRRPSFLSQSIRTPVVRSLDLERTRQARKVDLPLRILGVVSSPTGYDELDSTGERRKLSQALNSLTANGMVELHWLESGTLSELDRRIAQPDEIHVLHYIGHGAYDESTESGTVILETPRGRPHEVSGEELGAMLQDEESLRLVVLNSCEGARTSHVDPFSGVAASLIEFEVPAVIGMQFEITDEAAIAFSDRLYTSLAQGFPVDAALAQARRAIVAAGKETEFATPVLFLRATDVRLFDIGEHPPRAPADAMVDDSVCDFAVNVTQHPAPARPAEKVTWELVIENTGNCELREVTAQSRGGNTLVDDVLLRPGRAHKARWSEPLDPELTHYISVTATDPAGSSISHQITAVPVARVSPRAEARVPRPSEEVRVAVAPKETAAASPLFSPAMPERRDAIQRALAAMAGDPGVFFAPAIPAKRLAGLRDAANVPPDEEIVAMVDLSLFGWGKSSLLFGLEAMYNRNLAVSPNSLDYTALCKDEPRFQWTVIHQMIVGDTTINLAGLKGDREKLQTAIANLREALASGSSESSR